MNLPWPTKKVLTILFYFTSGVRELLGGPSVLVNPVRSFWIDKEHLRRLLVLILNLAEGFYHILLAKHSYETIDFWG